MSTINNQTQESLKEIGRWILLFVVSWVVTSTLDQVVKVPEFYTLKVWMFEYLIPIRLGFQMVLTLIGRFADRYIHENPNIPLKGIMPWFLN